METSGGVMPLAYSRLCLHKGRASKSSPSPDISLPQHSSGQKMREDRKVSYSSQKKPMKKVQTVHSSVCRGANCVQKAELGVKIRNVRKRSRRRKTKENRVCDHSRQEAEFVSTMRKGVSKGIGFLNVNAVHQGMTAEERSCR